MYQKRVSTCSERIAYALKYRNMKQSELCRIAKVPKSSLSLYLSGAYEPKKDRLEAMDIALSVSEAWLIGYDVPMDRFHNLQLFASPKEVEIETSDLTEGEIALLKALDKLTEDEVRQVIEYAEFLISKRGK